MGMTTAPADMLLTMSQTPAPVAPIFPTQDRAVLPGTLPVPAGTVGMPGAFDPLAAAAGGMVPPPTLPRKKRTTATRICKVEGCTKGIRSRGLCKAHGGGRRCTTPGCTTSDQGGGHCVLHGEAVAAVLKAARMGAVPGLFIGSYGAANNLEALKTTGITHVLCVSPTLPLNFPDVFTYLQLQVADLSSVRISDYFDDAFGFIDRCVGRMIV
ncbi:Parafibromin [Phytophthora nicotianae]|uniref:Parafibromin n=1 Tax=Phytophthora nicotianae TaxID=4792 RepID=A0A0W8D1Q7_PHYNI|nr:Parafibromin [Phytophthora nicotianae]